MKIILAGKHELACKLFDLLYGKKDVELRVITCQSEDKKLNQRETLKRKIGNLNISPLNKDYLYENLLENIIQFQPDIFISAGYDKIIKRDILDFTYCINIHFGLLPKYRGSFSIPWAIMNNEDYIGITLHRMDIGIDDGDIIFQEKIYNDYKKSCKTLYLSAMEVGTELTNKFIKIFMNNDNNKISTTPQDELIATYYSPEYPNNYKIDWKQSTIYIYNYIRACYFPPYNPAYTMIKSKKIKIEFPVDFLISKNTIPHGHIVKINTFYWITTLNGLIKPQTIGIDSKKWIFQEFVEMNNLEGKRFE